jgi:ribosome-binding protein aMBF1 (putative translation factor)
VGEGIDVTKLSDQIRRAINESGMSRYRIGQLIELDKSVLSKFMAGKSGLSVEVLDRLGDLLKLKIVAGVKAKAGRKAR